MSLLLLLSRGSGSVAYSLSCSAGAYSLQGKPSTLSYTPGAARVDYSLPCATGSYAYNGGSVQLHKAVTLACYPGTYVYAGKAASLAYSPGTTKVDYTLQCATGAYNAHGVPASLVVVKRNDAKSGYWRDYFYRLQAEALQNKQSDQHSTKQVEQESPVRVAYTKKLPKSFAESESYEPSQRSTPRVACTAYYEDAPAVEPTFSYLTFMLAMQVPIADQSTLQIGDIQDDEEDDIEMLLLTT